MNRTIDAKFFILTREKHHFNKIQSVIDKELCEIYLIDRVNVLKKIISQFDKSILVVSETEHWDRNLLNRTIQDILKSYNSNVIKILYIGQVSDKILNNKVLYLNDNILEKNKEIYKVIEQLDVWGPRNYIRFGNKDSRIAFFRIVMNKKWRTGVIHDISASGMSCSFDKFTDIDINQNSSNIELCIKDKIFQLTGSFLIRRTFKSANMFVIVFTRRKTTGNIENLNSIIYKLNREHVLDKIKNIPTE